MRNITQKLPALCAAAGILCLFGSLLSTVPPVRECRADAAETVIYSGVKDLPFANGDPFKGADISSVIALERSGVRFYDRSGKEQDIFVTLADAGVNCIRVRVWNDPTSAGKGVTYGGGANDADTAVEIAKRCKDAGLAMLVDFHYSDFWADPAKQKAPKAWANYSVAQKADAISAFTSETLRRIGETGVQIAMVQVGNETTGGMCGVLLENGNWGDGVWNDLASLWNAGAKAVREYDPNILVALHFTNPEKTDTMLYLAKMAAQKHVDYDVFATSYYPYWHGTPAGLTKVLTSVAQTYHKKVMVAETSWAYTLENFDPGVNTISKQADLGNYVSYPVSAQGQSQFLTDLFRAVAAVPDGAGIGVFYWEPAWLPVSSDYNTAMQLWEQYGGGWAYSAAQEYDPDAKDFGGSGWENQALFDVSGKPLDSLYIFRQVRGDGQQENPQKSKNLLRNSGFEENGGWAGKPIGWSLRSTADHHFDVRAEDTHSGQFALHWYSEGAFSESTAQTDVQADADGIYRASIHIQGDESCRYTLSLSVLGGETKSVTGTGAGWSVWQEPAVEIALHEGDVATFLLTVSGGAGSFGSADDCEFVRIEKPVTTTSAETTVTTATTVTTTTVTTALETTTAAETTSAPETTTAVTTTSETAAPVVLHRGDVNCDGIVDVRDAVLLARHVGNDITAVLSDTGTSNADCDGSGKITPADLTFLLRALARLISLE